VDVAVDQPRDDPPSAEIALPNAEAAIQGRSRRPDPDQLLAGDQKMGAAPWLRVIQLGVQEKFEHGREAKVRKTT
jgi:hypothetical protein